MTLAPRAAACLVLAAALSQASMAQDLELYDQPEFRGVKLTLDSGVPDLASFGLGDRVASVVVRRGQWEFCTGPQFSGACITVGPGRYGQLPPALRGTLSSLRLAGAPALPGERPRPVAGGTVAGAPARTSVVLYSGEFGGRQVEIAAATTDLRDVGFNDQAGSVDILAGTWDLCTDGAYGGACLTLAPGRYVLPPDYVGQISSLRPQPGSLAPAMPGRLSPPARPAAVVLHENSGLRGRQLAVDSSQSRLDAQGFNDKASSLEITRGRWQLCEHADFQGRCIVLGPGRHELGATMQDSLSSLRPVFGHDDRPLPAAGGVTLHETGDFGGRSLLRTEATHNFGDIGFNDRARSIDVHAGRWEFCSDAQFSGRCETFPPGRHVLSRELAGRVSSMRPR